MDLDELFPAKKPKTVTFGEDLAALSIELLEERLRLIADERARVEAEIAAKRSARAAADAVFKR